MISVIIILTTLKWYDHVTLNDDNDWIPKM